MYSLPPVSPLFLTAWGQGLGAEPSQGSNLTGVVSGRPQQPSRPGIGGYPAFPKEETALSRPGAPLLLLASQSLPASQPHSSPFLG